MYQRHKWEQYATCAIVGASSSELCVLREAAEAQAVALGGFVAFAVISVGAVGRSLRVHGRIAGTGKGRCLVDGDQRYLRLDHRLAPGSLPIYVAVTLVLAWGLPWWRIQPARHRSSSAPHAVGTALTLQTALVFLLMMVIISAVTPLREAGRWPLAFSILVAGLFAGKAAMRRLRKLRIGGNPAPLGSRVPTKRSTNRTRHAGVSPVRIGQP